MEDKYRIIRPDGKDIFKKTLTMTREYLDYLERHWNNVQKAFHEFDRRLHIMWNEEKYNSLVMELFQYYPFIDEYMGQHDMSKFSEEEFVQYRKNFYPVDDDEKKDNKEAFAKAVKHHIDNNAHHWQYRASIKNYYDPLAVVENVCDWIAMSYEFNEPIKKYWDENKDKMNIDKCERKDIELIFELFEEDI